MTRFETDAIHAGQEPDPVTGAVVPAIYQTSTYKQDGVGGLRSGYEYSRSGNPTRTALEVNLAALERGRFGFATSSGLSAEDLILRAVLKPGDHIIVPIDAYGGSYRLINRVYTPWGISHTAVDQNDVVAVEKSIQPGKTKAIWVETPTNPLLAITDIEAISALARAHDLTVIVDNTFASPYLQQPLNLGADIVIHSTTKYLGGHSDVIGGAVITSNPALAEKIGFLHNAMGPVAGPMDAWLVLRGIRTLGVRMDRHTFNAKAVVRYLQGNSQITEIFYPGLPGHKGHEIAKRQMRDFGGMVSFRVKGGAEKALRVCEKVQIFTLAESLGGVESLIEHPARMTHASVSGSPLEVPDDLIRLSVGIEHIDDLIEDLERAL